MVGKSANLIGLLSELVLSSISITILLSGSANPAALDFIASILAWFVDRSVSFSSSFVRWLTATTALKDNFPGDSSIASYPEIREVKLKVLVMLTCMLNQRKLPVLGSKDRNRRGSRALNGAACSGVRCRMIPMRLIGSGFKELWVPRRYFLTILLFPSAPTSNVPSALVPSLKCALMPPPSNSSISCNDFPSWTSIPVASKSRNCCRCTRIRRFVIGTL